MRSTGSDEVIEGPNVTTAISKNEEANNCLEDHEADSEVMGGPAKIVVGRISILQNGGRTIGKEGGVGIVGHGGADGSENIEGSLVL